jgi:hypothetical protein
MALVANLRAERAVLPEWLERSRVRVIQELGVSPSAGVWESLGVLLDSIRLFVLLFVFRMSMFRRVEC